MKKIYSLMLFAVLIIAASSIYAQTNQVADSSFEAGTPSTAWTETSTNFGTPLCDAASCGTCGGPCVPHSGSWYAWFGGTTLLEIASLTQSVTIPSGTSAILSFWYKIAIANNAGIDTIGILIDGTPVWFSTTADSSTYTNYTKIVIPINSYANGAAHVLTFGSRSHGPNVSNLLIDDISIIVYGSSGIYSNHIIEGINVYPNPTTEKVFIDVNAPKITDYKVMMYNMQGKLVYENTYTNFNHGKIEVNTSNMAKGSYSLVIDNSYERIIEKIIVK